MKYKIFLYFLVPILFFSCNNNLETKSPNVIIVITDDQGYGDIGYNGNPYLITPNLDKFAGASHLIDEMTIAPKHEEKMTAEELAENKMNCETLI